ncbi:MAG: DUF2188 domain-containing protein [Anaerolineae bacterium]
MPWDTDHYPPSMKNLGPHIRSKAVEIANALLEEGYAEGHAIPIAIATARKWAEHADHNRHAGVHQLHVVPHPEGWAIRRADARRASFVFNSREQAQHKALEMAEEENGSIIVHDDDGQISHQIILNSWQ